jgi:hypothetical protein
MIEPAKTGHARLLPACCLLQVICMFSKIKKALRFFARL